MIFTPLASSSAGNAYLVDDGQTKLLLECGISYRRIQKCIGFCMADINGCLLSHEHKDHANCYAELIKNGVPVYASAGTAEALGCNLIIPIGSDAAVTIGTFQVLSFATFHDAAEPIGFLIRSTVDGDKLMFATDTVNLGYQFPGVNLVALECNYADEILARATKIHDQIWFMFQKNEISDSGKILYIYLFSCHHRTLVGLYKLPIPYISVDIGFSVQTVKKLLIELESKNLIEYDMTNSCVLVKKFLEYNGIPNKNVEKAAIKIIDTSLPSTNLLEPFLQELAKFKEKCPTLFETVLKLYCKQFHEQYEEQYSKWYGNKESRSKKSEVRSQKQQAEVRRPSGRVLLTLKKVMQIFSKYGDSATSKWAQ